MRLGPPGLGEAGSRLLQDYEAQSSPAHDHLSPHIPLHGPGLPLAATTRSAAGSLTPPSSTHCVPCRLPQAAHLATQTQALTLLSSHYSPFPSLLAVSSEHRSAPALSTAQPLGHTDLSPESTPTPVPTPPFLCLSILKCSNSSPRRGQSQNIPQLDEPGVSSLPSSVLSRLGPPSFPWQFSPPPLVQLAQIPAQEPQVRPWLSVRSPHTGLGARPSRLLISPFWGKHADGWPLSCLLSCGSPTRSPPVPTETPVPPVVVLVMAMWVEIELSTIALTYIPSPVLFFLFLLFF